MAALKLDLEGERYRLKDFATQFDAGDIIDEKSGLSANDLLAVLIALGQASWKPEDGDPEPGRHLGDYLTEDD